MKKLSNITKRRHNEQGATIIEYVLIVVLLSIAAIVAFGTVANSVNDRFNNVASTIKGT